MCGSKHPIIWRAHTEFFCDLDEDQDTEHIGRRRAHVKGSKEKNMFRVIHLPKAFIKRLVPNWERSTSGCILSPCLFNLDAEYIMRNAGLDEAEAGIKIARRSINNLR